MTDDEKLSIVENHHRVKFKVRPSHNVINHLYTELLKFNRMVRDVVERDPKRAEKIEASSQLKRIVSKRPKLTLIETAKTDS